MARRQSQVSSGPPGVAIIGSMILAIIVSVAVLIGRGELPNPLNYFG